MINFWPALAEIALGLAFCVFGFPFARFILALWGAVIGFVWGVAGYTVLVASVGGPTGNIAPWILGMIGAVVISGLAYAFYSVAVLMSMASLGLGLSHLLANSFALPPWVAVTLGVVAAIAFVILGFSLGLPRLFLMVLTSLIGAGAIVHGTLLLLGRDPDWLKALIANPSWGIELLWPAMFVVITIVGVVIQSRQHSSRTLRAVYQ